MSTTALSRQRKKTGAKQNVTPSLVHWRFVVVLVVITGVQRARRPCSLHSSY